ncbi:22650_t:CDS:1, partial [Cetraspora pellucida]
MPWRCWYMPVWNWDEINICRKMLYKHLEKEKVSKLFHKWGGIPRFVLEKANDQTQQDKLLDAIARCDEKIFTYIEESESGDHKLIHINTNVLIEENNIELKNSDPYTQKVLKFASDYIGERVTIKLEKTIKSRLNNEIKLSLSCGKSNQFLGNCFEQIAQRMLRGGGEFNVRSLDSDQLGTIKLNRQNEILIFSAVDAINNGEYCQPNNKNFPSIDSIIAPNMLFQMTTTREHNIKMIGLIKLYSKLSKTGNIDLFFVVPAILYNGYKKQKFINGTNGMPNWIRNQ